MGSYNSFKFDANTDPTTIPSIRARFDNVINTDRGAFDYCWRKWSPNAKWDPTDKVIAVSKEFPDILFSLECHGDSGSWKYYYLDGKECWSGYVDKPVWPTFAKIRAGFKKKEAAHKQKMAEKLASDKEELKKQADELEKRRQEILKKLEQ